MMFQVAADSQKGGWRSYAGNALMAALMVGFYVLLILVTFGVQL